MVLEFMHHLTIKPPIVIQQGIIKEQKFGRVLVLGYKIATSLLFARSLKGKDMEKIIITTLQLFQMKTILSSDTFLS